MKIAFIVITFPKISETFILNQITGLIDLGHEVDIFALWDPHEQAIHADVEKYHLRSKVHYLFSSKNRRKRILRLLSVFVRHLWRHPIALRRCLDFRHYGRSQAINNCLKLDSFLSKRYDVFHCHFGHLGEEMIFLKEIFPHTKFFVSFHGFDLDSKDFRTQGFYDQLFQKSDGVITAGEYYRKTLIGLGCPREKLINHPNGIDTSLFVRNSTPRSSNDIVITTVARLEEEKNIPFALTLIHGLKAKLTFRYYLIGDGSLKGQVINQIKELGLESTVRLMGDLPRQEVVNILNETDIFLLTSQRETFGLALVEAQAMEIPIVAANVGGVSGALQDKTTGFLFNAGNQEEAQKHILTLIADPALRHRMGMAGKKFATENFDIRKLNNRLTLIYKG